MRRHLHIDALGGLSGDMFAAMMLSALPGAADRLRADLRAAGLDPHVGLEIAQTRKSGFAATRIVFDIAAQAPPTHHWRDIRRLIETSDLRAPVRHGAIAIFEGLAEAEAACHGIAVEQVHFHEIADWDSIADIVAAASLIDSAGATSWSCSELPLGGGKVRTQHGLIPVPVPATAHLLTGFRFVDDGVTGERITPTGAAILRHLAPRQGAVPAGLTLTGSGTGAGQRELDGIPNICRLLCFEAGGAVHGDHDLVGSIAFEIDDMTPEEISVALDRIRADEGVLDAGYTLGHGKKSRIRYNVTVLSKPHLVDAVAALCLAETSTIGLRLEPLRRRILGRRAGSVNGLRVKTVDRPGGATTKVESDDLAGIATLAARRAAGEGASDG